MSAAARVVRLGPDDVALLRSLNELFAVAVAFDERTTYLAEPPTDA